MQSTGGPNPAATPDDAVWASTASLDVTALRPSSRVLVVGLGEAGIYTVRALLQAGHLVWAVESKPQQKAPSPPHSHPQTPSLPDLTIASSASDLHHGLGLETPQGLDAYAKSNGLSHCLHLGCHLEKLTLSSGGSKWTAEYHDAQHQRRMNIDVEYAVLCTGHNGVRGAQLLMSGEASSSTVINASLSAQAVSPRSFGSPQQLYSRECSSDMQGKNVVVHVPKGASLASTSPYAEGLCSAANVTLVMAEPCWPLLEPLGPSLSLSQLVTDTQLAADMLPPYYTKAPPVPKQPWHLFSGVKRRLFWEQIKSEMQQTLGPLAPSSSVLEGLLAQDDVLRLGSSSGLANSWLSKATKVLGEVERHCQSSVVLSTGKEVPCDIMLRCSASASKPGPAYPFLDAKTRQLLGLGAGPATDGLFLYRGIFHPSVPNLAFVGSQVRTVHRSLTYTLQAEWIAAVLTDRVALPKPEAMLQDLQAQRRWRQGLPLHAHSSSLFLLYEVFLHAQLLGDLGQLPMQVMGCLCLAPQAKVDVHQAALQAAHVSHCAAKATQAKLQEVASALDGVHADKGHDIAPPQSVSVLNSTFPNIPPTIFSTDLLNTQQPSPPSSSLTPVTITAPGSLPPRMLAASRAEASFANRSYGSDAHIPPLAMVIGDPYRTTSSNTQRSESSLNLRILSTQGSLNANLALTTQQSINRDREKDHTHSSASSVRWPDGLVIPRNLSAASRSEYPGSRSAAGVIPEIPGAEAEAVALAETMVVGSLVPDTDSAGPISVGATVSATPSSQLPAGLAVQCKDVASSSSQLCPAGQAILQPQTVPGSALRMLPSMSGSSNANSSMLASGSAWMSQVSNAVGGPDSGSNTGMHSQCTRSSSMPGAAIVSRSSLGASLNRTCPSMQAYVDAGAVFGFRPAATAATAAGEGASSSDGVVPVVGSWPSGLQPTQPHSHCVSEPKSSPITGLPRTTFSPIMEEAITIGEESGASSHRSRSTNETSHMKASNGQREMLLAKVVDGSSSAPCKLASTETSASLSDLLPSCRQPPVVPPQLRDAGVGVGLDGRPAAHQQADVVAEGPEVSLHEASMVTISRRRLSKSSPEQSLHKELAFDGSDSVSFPGLGDAGDVLETIPATGLIYGRATEVPAGRQSRFRCGARVPGRAATFCVAATSTSHLRSGLHAAGMGQAGAVQLDPAAAGLNHHQQAVASEEPADAEAVAPLSMEGVVLMDMDADERLESPAPGYSRARTFSGVASAYSSTPGGSSSSQARVWQGGYSQPMGSAVVITPAGGGVAAAAPARRGGISRSSSSRGWFSGYQSSFGGNISRRGTSMVVDDLRKLASTNATCKRSSINSELGFTANGTRAVSTLSADPSGSGSSGREDVDKAQVGSPTSHISQHEPDSSSSRLGGESEGQQPRSSSTVPISSRTYAAWGTPSVAVLTHTDDEGWGDSSATRQEGLIDRPCSQETVESPRSSSNALGFDLVELQQVLQQFSAHKADGSTHSLPGANGSISRNNGVWNGEDDRTSRTSPPQANTGLEGQATAPVNRSSAHAASTRYLAALQQHLRDAHTTFLMVADPSPAPSQENVSSGPCPSNNRSLQTDPDEGAIYGGSSLRPQTAGDSAGLSRNSRTSPPNKMPTEGRAANPLGLVLAKHLGHKAAVLFNDHHDCSE